MKRRTFFAAIAGAVIAPFWKGKRRGFSATYGMIKMIKPIEVRIPEMTTKRGAEITREVIIPELWRALKNASQTVC